MRSLSTALRLAIAFITVGLILMVPRIALAQAGSLKVTSFPSGASVSVDGVPSGKVTPMSISLAIGTHTIVVSIPNSGWNADSRSVDIVSGNNDLSVTLLPMVTNGLPGPQGPKGDTGATGPQGPKGETGATGPQGLQGPQGSKGDTGATGLQGLKGDKGDTGQQGLKGDKGDAGQQGPKGDTGNAGPQGPKGDTGDTGPQGAQGPQGPQGPAGSGTVNGGSGQVAFFDSSTSVTSSPGFLWDNVHRQLSVSAPAGAAIIASVQAPSASANYGVTGIANGSNLDNIGLEGETTGSGSEGVRGLVSGSANNSVGVYGVNVSNIGGISTAAYGVYGEATGLQASAGSVHIGVFGDARGGTVNVAGHFGGGGELVIPNAQGLSANPLLPRSFAGSIFSQVATATTTGGRLYYTAGGFDWFVNSTGSADFSEYFTTSDRSLAIGEVIALDPDLANGVRRARPRDAASTVGVVSEFGSRDNDTRSGDRSDDPDYVNVGLHGHVPVLVTLENGPIKPGDPLTVSPTVRGRATKAVGPSRIIGYALTHFPYVNGEKDYLDGPDDVAGSHRLSADHVMSYVSAGWYAPSETTSDGVEPPRLESASETLQRFTKQHNAEMMKQPSQAVAAR